MLNGQTVNLYKKPGEQDPIKKSNLLTSCMNYKCMKRKLNELYICQT